MENTQHETRTRNYECKMMHDMLMQKDLFIYLFIFEGLIQSLL